MTEQLSLDLTKDSTLSIICCEANQTIVQNATCYPLFPLPTDTSDYGRYMYRIRSVAEKWLYTQGFYCSKFHRIPDGLASYPLEIEFKPEGRIQKIEKIPVLAKLIINLAGKEVKKFLQTNLPTRDTEKNRMTYMYTYHRNCLEFLKASGAYLTHVCPENLLTYEHHLIYIENHSSDCSHIRKMDSVEYRRISTQSWLDVILQVYKIYNLYRVDYPITTPDYRQFESESLNPSASCSFQTEGSCYNLPSLSKSKQGLKSVYSKQFLASLENHQLESTMYSKSEMIILHWLEFHFERNRPNLWSPEKHGHDVYRPTKRKIRFFEIDLRDSLIFGAVIASYCPYLREHISSMYCAPTKPEQIYHNACKIVQAWHWLKLSFDITPESIVKPNILEMVMMANYMYQVFPSFYPRDTIVMKCCFTEEIQHELLVDNQSDAAITYYVLFFGEDKKYFESACQILVIQSKQTRSLTIKFNAKSMVKVSAVLVLTGEYPGRRYARAIAINLVGIPDITVANYELSIEKNLYEVTTANIDIESPYKVEAKYDAVITADPFADKVTFSKWMSQVEFKLPGRLFPRQNTYEFDAEGKCSIQVNLCCGSPYPQSYWIYFLNPEVGDFAMKITITGKITKKNNEKVNVTLPRGFLTAKCICNPDSKGFLQFCSRTVTVDIPRKNHIFWDSVINMLMACVRDENYAFYRKYLAIPTGKRVLRLVSEHQPDTNAEMDYVFQKSAEFKITFKKNIGVKAHQTIIMDDMTINGSVPLLLHMDEGVTMKKLLIKLEEMNGHETRFYNLIFHENECLEDDYGD